jgi:uncharacterized protein
VWLKLKKSAQFYSENHKIQADLYLPKNHKKGEKWPAIILCHGFAGIREAFLPEYATEFARNGFAALIFDYRGFGDSEGARGRLIPDEQITDIRNAITYLQTLDEIDVNNISLWGTSFGGANAICVAAMDKRVKSLVVQLAFGNGERVIKGNLSPEEQKKLDTVLQRAWEKYVTKNKSLGLSPDQLLKDQESKDFYAKVETKYPKLDVKIPFISLKYIMEHKPENHISNVKVPVLIIAAEKDTPCPVEESKILYEKANNPKKLHILKNTKHYEVYDPHNLTLTAQKAVEWFVNT